MKRKLEMSNDDGGPPTKKQKFDSAFSFESVDEVTIVITTIKAQNRELMAKMRQQKEDIKGLEKINKSVKKENSQCYMYMGIIEQIWDTLLADITNLYNNHSVSGITPEMEIPSSIKFLIKEKEMTMEKMAEKLKLSFNERKDKIVGLISSFINFVTSETTKWKQCREELRISVEKVSPKLSEDNALLERLYESSKTKNQSMEFSMEGLKNDLKNNKTKLDIIRNNRKTLEKQMFTIKEELERKERNDHRYDIGKEEQDSIILTEAPIKQEEIEVKKEEVIEVPLTNVPEDVAILQNELKNITQIAEDRLKDYEALKKENIELLKNKEFLQAKEQKLDETVVTNTPFYKALESKYLITVEENMTMKEEIEKYKKRFNGINKSKET